MDRRTAGPDVGELLPGPARAPAPDGSHVDATRVAIAVAGMVAFLGMAWVLTGDRDAGTPAPPPLDAPAPSPPAPPGASPAPPPPASGLLVH